MARRIVRPVLSKWKIGQIVVGSCDATQDATGEVVGRNSELTLVGPFPDYALVTSPGVTIRVTISNGDHQVDDLLSFHDQYVRLAA